MSELNSPHPNAANVRRLAKRFTRHIPKHHPFLDKNFPVEDAALVPSELAPRGRLNWELPGKAEGNCHIIAELTSWTNELLDEVHEKLSQHILSEWDEMHEWLEAHCNSDDHDLLGLLGRFDSSIDRTLFHLMEDIIRKYDNNEKKTGRLPNLRTVNWHNYEDKSGLMSPWSHSKASN